MSSASSASSSGSEQASSSSPPPHKRARISDDSDSKNSAQSDDSSNESESESDEGEDDDTPVLSHAEKRRQKKKEELAAKKGKRVAEDAKDAKGKAKVKNTAELPPSKVPKRQNSVWVGNLAFKTTPASLRNFFEGVGEITRIHMPMKMATGGLYQPTLSLFSFAYVDFATPDAKTIAITRSENPLDGRRLLIKDGDDYKGRPAPSTAPGEDCAEAGAAAKTAGLTKTAQKILRVQKQPPGPTLFLGNLGFETTEQSIRALLDSHRPKGGDDKEKWIRKVRMGTFEDSGKCKGWAFVDFTSTEHATAALTNPRNHTLDGRKLVVEYASPEALRRGGGAGPPRDRDRGDRDRATKRDRAPRSAPTDDTSGRPAKRPRTGAGDGAEAGGKGEDGERGGGAERKAANFKSGRKADAAGKGPRPRARPGAALALAKREDVSIQPSQGKKIVF
ncbi:hypothetical protein BD413DRAFT_548290 [Trametes elegans]|nr:hypothetical protein BD413DRAFT_548290 [Trametes elegans]